MAAVPLTVMSLIRRSLSAGSASQRSLAVDRARVGGRGVTRANSSTRHVPACTARCGSTMPTAGAPARSFPIGVTFPASTGMRLGGGGLRSTIARQASAAPRATARGWGATVSKHRKDGAGRIIAVAVVSGATLAWAWDRYRGGGAATTRRRRRSSEEVQRAADAQPMGVWAARSTATRLVSSLLVGDTADPSDERGGRPTDGEAAAGREARLSSAESVLDSALVELLYVLARSRRARSKVVEGGGVGVLLSFLAAETVNVDRIAATLDKLLVDDGDGAGTRAATELSEALLHHPGLLRALARAQGSTPALDCLADSASMLPPIFASRADGEVALLASLVADHHARASFRRLSLAWLRDAVRVEQGSPATALTEMLLSEQDATALQDLLDDLRLAAAGRGPFAGGWTAEDTFVDHQALAASLVSELAKRASAMADTANFDRSAGDDVVAELHAEAALLERMLLQVPLHDSDVSKGGRKHHGVGTGSGSLPGVERTLALWSEVMSTSPTGIAGYADDSAWARRRAAATDALAHVALLPHARRSLVQAGFAPALLSHVVREAGVTRMATTWPKYHAASKGGPLKYGKTASSEGSSGSRGGDAPPTSEHILALSRLVANLSLPLPAHDGQPYQCELQLESAGGDLVDASDADPDVGGESFSDVLRDFRRPRGDISWLDVGLFWSLSPDAQVRESAINLLYNLATNGKHRDVVRQQWLLALVSAVCKSDATPRRLRVEVSRELLSVGAGGGVVSSVTAARGSVPVVQADVKSTALQRHGLKALTVLLNDPSLHEELLNYGVDNLLYAMASTDETAVQRQCARAIAALATSPRGRETTASRGRTPGHDSAGASWTRKLREWRGSSVDAKLRVYSTRALANLGVPLHEEDGDTAVAPAHVYGDSVFPVYLPSPRDAGADVDVVFVHGLRGGAIRTWRVGDVPLGADTHFLKKAKAEASDVPKPPPPMTTWIGDWLPGDLAARGLRPRVLALRYEANLTSVASARTSLTLVERAGAVVEQLARAGVGTDPKRPVIFVTHSMGGLLVKAVLARGLPTGVRESGVVPQKAASDRRAQSAPPVEPQEASLVDSTAGVMFIATPHAGSPIAGYAPKGSTYMGIHPAVAGLREGDATLLALQRDFAKVSRCAQRPTVTDVEGAQNIGDEHCPGCDVLSIGEALPSAIGLGLTTVIVPPRSADPGLGRFTTVAADHITVCKPFARLDDARYTLVRDFVVSAAKARLAAGAGGEPSG